MMSHNDSKHRKKCAFPPHVTFYDETKVQFGCGYLEARDERTVIFCDPDPVLEFIKLSPSATIVQKV